jgi:hypothetical protein
MSFDHKKKRPGHKAEPTAIDAILGKLLKRPALQEGITKYKFVLQWHNIVGADLATRTKPLGIWRNKLTVEVESSSLAQEIGFQKHVILKRLQQYLEGGIKVEDIHFRVVG